MSQAQSEVLTLTRQEFEAARANIYFIDSSVPDAEALALGLGEGSNVYMLDPTGDGLEQIANALQGQQVDAMHIYSHGRKGAIQLAGQWYDAAALDAAASTLARIGQSLNAGGDILLYGCNTASGSLGESFLERMARLASANVAASTDITGTGGDWQLEASAGTVDSEARQPDHWMGNLNTGDSLANWGVLEGTENNDTITGFVTNDRLYGQGGVDVLSGGQGHDIYYITGENSAGTRIVEKDLEGTDTVYSNVKDFTLGLSAADNLPSTESSSVEYIVLNQQEGFLSQNATGSSAAQTLVGNALSNRLTGGGGNDLLYGYDGDDYLDGGNGNLTDVTNEEDYNTGDSVTMYGGKNDDQYIVRNAGDVVSENNNEGNDAVYSFVDYTLGSNVENLVLLDGADQSTSATTAKGNALSNELRGNQHANTLLGEAGNDTLYGYAGNDILYGGAGNDLLYGGQGDNTLLGGDGNDTLHGDADKDSLQGDAGNDTLYGYEGDDTLQGGAGNDLLVGGAGSDSLKGGDGNDTLYGDSTATNNARDTLVGGAGNDAFYVYHADDSITDSAGQDSLYINFAKSSQYTLADGIEQAFVQGEATNILGNSLANRIVGHDSLGSALNGGMGNDTLEGGSGNDTFYVDNAGDMIIDKGGTNELHSTVTVDLNRFANARVQTVSLTGSANINATARRDVATSLFGNEGNNVLTGGNMDDRLDGGALGVNRLVGGAGDDVYVVRNSSTTVVEAAGTNNGRDAVTAYVDHTLAANVEDLVLAQTTADTDDGDSSVRGATIGTGNNLANKMDGSSITGGAILHGGVNSAGLAGDTLIGSTGNDQIYSYNANDSIEFGGGNDVLYVSYSVAEADADLNFDWSAYFSARGVNLPATVTVMYRGNPVTVTGPGVYLQGSSQVTNLVGTVRADTLVADSTASSTLDGGAGADLMQGGAGHDALYTDNAGDIAYGGGGNDTLYTSVNIDFNKTYKDSTGAYARQFNSIEELRMLGTAGLSVVGNREASGRNFYGNSGNNNITGCLAETITDPVDSIKGNYIDGGAGNDTLSSGRTHDTLIGGAGADVMTGGDGNDEYYIDHASDRVVEKAGEGTDSIYSNGISINLGAANHSNVEYVKNTGAKASLLGSTRTDVDETLVAGNAGDTLDGKGGGADNILGGTGADSIFYYGTEQSIEGGSGRDTLTVRKTFTDSITLEDNGISGIEAVVLETGTTNQKAADVNASHASLGVMVQGNSGYSSITGSQGNDTLYGGGGKDTILAGDGNDFVEIAANAVGYGELNGGNGEDTLSFGTAADRVTFANGQIVQRVSNTNVTVEANNFNVYSGGAGNDTLDASAQSSAMALAGGLGVDQLLGGAGSDTLIADGGNDIITTGAGADIVRLTAAAIGSTITVNDFDSGVDSVDDSALRAQGWGEPSRVQNGANATLTWTNPNNTREKVILVLKNTVSQDVLFGHSKEVENGFNGYDSNPDIPYDLKTSTNNISITGGNRNDAIVSTGQHNTLYGMGGDDVLEGSHNSTMDGGNGNDTIYVIRAEGDASLSVNGGAGNDEIGIDTIGSGSFTLDGGTGDDILYFDSTPVNLTFNNEGQVTSIGMSSVVATGSSSGIEMHWGSTGDDSVNASQSSTTVVYGTGGGNDTYIGSSSSDEVHLHRLDANSALSLSGGDNGSDDGTGSDYLSFAQDQAIQIALDSAGNVSTLITDGETVGNSTITGFENFWLGDMADAVTADTDAISAITPHNAFAVRAGRGNDTITLGDIISNKFDVYMQTEDGNDSVSVGVISTDAEGSVTFSGGAGSDTLAMKAASGKGLYLKFDNTGNISSTDSTSGYYNASDEDANLSSNIKTSISGFEHFDGSANAANFFDAGAYSMTGGTLGLYGGEGHDMFYLGDVQAGSVTLMGGEDTPITDTYTGGTRPGKGDRFHIGNVGASASIKIEAGTGDKVKDKLDFDGNQAVSLTLDSKGDISAVSMNGQKVNITGTGLSAYEGTDGNDKIDASRVTSVDSWDNVMTLEGGFGDDTILTGNISGRFIVEVGAGADSIVGGAGNDYIGLGDNPDDPDDIPRDESNFPLNNDGKDTITTGGGHDYIQVFEQDNGSITTITDFAVGTDELDDTGLLKDGWSRSIATTSGLAGVTVTYSKTDESSGSQKEFHLQFTNQNSTTFLPATRSLLPNDSLVAVTGPVQVYGTPDSDNCTIHGSGAITLDGNGGNDSITLEGDSSRDSLWLQGDASTGVYTITGKEGADQLYLEHVDGAQVSARGGADNDSITLASATNGKITLDGGEGTDTFYLGPISESAQVVIDGGNNPQGSDTGDVLQLLGTGSTVSISSNPADSLYLYGVENVQGTTDNDSIDASAYTASPGEYNGKSFYSFVVKGGQGNDTIIGGSNMLLNGNEGNDLLIVDSNTANAWVRGGSSGTDTLSLEHLGDVSLTAQVTRHDGIGTTLGLRTSNGIIAVEEIDVIKLADTGSRVTINEKVTNVTLTGGSGIDTLVLDEAGNGSVIHIRDFDLSKDSIEATGWQCSTALDSNNTKRTYTKNGNTITVWQDNVIDIRSWNSEGAYTLSGGYSMAGTEYADTVTVNLGGNKATYLNTNGGNDTIILNPDGNISSEKSFDAYGGTGNDLFRVGAVTTQENSNTGICLNGGDGADTYALRAEGYALTIDETSEADYNSSSPDRIEFYGVQLQPGSESAFLSKLSFSLEDNDVAWNGKPLQILKISGVDSQSSSAALNFQSFNFTGDVMNFYDENGNKLLSGDIDIKSIVDTIQNNNSTSTNLSFTMGDDGKYKASS